MLLHLKYIKYVYTLFLKSPTVEKHLNQPMLTSPTVPADIWIGGWSSPWWTLVPIFRLWEITILVIHLIFFGFINNLVGVLEVVGRHNPFETIVVPKHKGNRHLLFLL